jgi:glycosyltransferase involved in cell wall biosynthesis
VNLCTWQPEPRFLREAVESLLHQSFQDFELVIVEDPSPVSAREELGNLLLDKRIRHYRNPRRCGLLRQKNQALRLSRGELVAILDHDDVAEPARLERQVTFLEKYPQVVAVGTWLTAIDENNRVLGKRRYPTQPEAINQAIRRYSPLAHPSVMFRKKAVVGLGGYKPTSSWDPLGLVSDYDLWCRMVLAGMSLANLPDYLLRYRVHRGAQKWLQTKVFLRATLDLKQKYWGQHFTARDWLRSWGEELLLGLPAPALWWLFRFLAYRP